MSNTEEKTRITAPVDLSAFEGESRPALFVMSPGRYFGKKFVLEEDVVTLGRSSKCTIHIDEDDISRQHIVLTVESDGRVRLSDPGSTNGTLVNKRRVPKGDGVYLENGDQVCAGKTILKFVAKGTIDNVFHDELYRQATHDPLTQIFNRRHFIDQLESEFRRAKRYGRDVSLVLFDLDHFKRVNDTHGHPAGDYVLKETARLIQRNLRGQDIFARFGGEEFSVLLPETNSESAYMLADKLRQSVQAHTYCFQGTDINVTISLGVATMGEKHGDFADLIESSDQQLYRAKESGRNRVCIQQAA